jgi:hypothetical protein
LALYIGLISGMTCLTSVNLFYEAFFFALQVGSVSGSDSSITCKSSAPVVSGRFFLALYTGSGSAMACSSSEHLQYDAFCFWRCIYLWQMIAHKQVQFLCLQGINICLSDVS